MENITILERGTEQDRDANFRICTYDDSGKTFKVVVTPQAVKDLNRFDLDLDRIAKYAVEWARSEGHIEGNVVVSTQLPDFHRFERWLTTIFKMAP